MRNSGRKSKINDNVIQIIYKTGLAEHSQITHIIDIMSVINYRMFQALLNVPANRNIHKFTLVNAI